MNQKIHYKHTQYEIRYQIDQSRCGKCGLPAIHMAHRIAATKVNIKKYGWEIIQHCFNLIPACCLEHNDFWNIANKPERCKKLVDLINTRGEELLTSDIITRRIND